MLKFGDLIKDAEYYNFDNTDTEPEISVIMPVYCHNGKLLRRSIESVLRQTFRNFELIIVDDGSRDGSFNTVLEYAQKDARVRIIRHKLNCGLPAIRVNEGILAARGKYISYQFDDDEYLPDCLEILHTEITSHDEPCLVYGKTVIRLEDRVVYIGAPYNYALLNNENQIANNSVMHHKCIMELSGMYDPHIILRRFCDYDLWLRMGRHVPFYFVDEEVTNVYAGQKGSLGADVAISNFPLLRRYLETYRDNRLIPEKINDYDVDSLTSTSVFNQGDIDTLNRIEIIPFLSRTTYYLDETEKNIFNITRNKKRICLLLKQLILHL
ncbi:MAG: glycosyltransferase [Ruminiclostridium sp.]|nr:glycosyltransferase [Ruminiclostridium sp.]